MVKLQLGAYKSWHKRVGALSLEQKCKIIFYSKLVYKGPFIFQIEYKMLHIHLNETVF